MLFFSQKQKTALATVLIIASVALFFPPPARAVTGAEICALLGIGNASGAATGAAGAATSALGLVVPVLDNLNLSVNTNSSFQLSAQNAKSCADALMTIALNAVIQITRDMVLRWITTGRFEKPALVASFIADPLRIAENASRIFLQRITNLPFCGGFDIPGRSQLSLDVNLGLNCSLPETLNTRDGSGNLDLYLHPERYSAIERLLITRRENFYPLVLNRTAAEKANEEARALYAFYNETTAGQGFLSTRNPDGSIRTPGSVVARAVMASQIEGPIQTGSVADTAQKAVAAIVDTALQVTINRGLNAAFRPSTGSAPATQPAPLLLPSREPIAQKIAEAVRRGSVFTINVAPTAEIQGITLEQIETIANLTRDLSRLGDRLQAADTAAAIQSASAEADTLSSRLDGAMRATNYCTTIAPSSHVCPAVP